MNRKIIFDIECLPNVFSFVGFDVDTGEHLEFVIFENDTSQLNDFLDFLDTLPNLIGYNNLAYDGQVIEHIYRGKVQNAFEIRAFSDELINCKERFSEPYKQWDFSFSHLDLMAMNNFTIYGKATSLKWLEFTTRQKSLADFEYGFNDVIPEEKLDDLLRYNRKDVEMTYKFYLLCSDGIKMRHILAKKFNDKFIYNQPNASIGEKIVLYSYCNATNQEPKRVKKKYTSRKYISVKDVLLPYIEFEEPIFQEVLDEFRNLELKSKNGMLQIKGAYSKEIEFQDMTVTYALGGIHGCVPSGIYRSSDTHVIMSHDVTSMYPNVAISNRFYPEHLGEVFCDVYDDVLEERRKYPKDTEPELNSAYKEGANSVFGKSNSKHNGFLKDPQYTIQTTVNGQLLLTMLGERLSKIGTYLMWNTDGSEIIIPRDKLDEYYQICNEWCELTGIDLEHDEYETMWIRNVNNYIAKYANGKVKRNGDFAIYEDYVGDWSKNPSCLIVPEAVNAYFLEGVPVDDTITNWNNIHDFLFGIKGGSTFEYWLVNIKDSVINSIERNGDRALRYYISNEGLSILKNWVGGKKLGDLPSAPAKTKGQMIKPLQNIRTNDGTIYATRRVKVEDAVLDDEGNVVEKAKYNKVLQSRYPDLNYNFYIEEAQKWINEIEL